MTKKKKKEQDLHEAGNQEQGMITGTAPARQTIAHNISLGPKNHAWLALKNCIHSFNQQTSTEYLLCAKH